MIRAVVAGVLLGIIGAHLVRMVAEEFWEDDPND